MVTAIDVLSRAKRKTLTLEAALDNTLSNDFDFYDESGGEISLGGHSGGTRNSNADIVISDGMALNSGSSDVIVSGLLRSSSLDHSFKGGSLREVSDIKITHRAGTSQLHKRNWKNKDITLKVGGYIDGAELRFQDYPVLLKAISLGRTYNSNQMSIGLSTMPKELKGLFPENTYRIGAKKGRAIPFVVGEIRIMSPVDLSDGDYQISDGAIESILAAYNDGVSLTVATSSDLSAETPLITEFFYDPSSGLCKVHNDVGVLSLELKGSTLDGTYSDNSIDILTYIIDRITGGLVPITTTILGDSIGFIFDQQRPLIDWINELLTSLDCYLLFNEVTNGIEVKRRHNGRYADADGAANIVDAFEFRGVVDGAISSGQDAIVEGSILNKGTIYRPKSTVVKYDRNWATAGPNGIDKARRVNIAREYRTVDAYNLLGTDPIRTVKSALIANVDAQRLADDDVNRLSGVNEEYTMTLKGSGHGLKVGSVGSIYDDQIIGGDVVELLSWTEEFNRVTSSDETRIQVIVYG